MLVQLAQSIHSRPGVPVQHSGLLRCDIQLSATVALVEGYISAETDPPLVRIIEPVSLRLLSTYTLYKDALPGLAVQLPTFIFRNMCIGLAPKTQR